MVPTVCVQGSTGNFGPYPEGRAEWVSGHSCDGRHSHFREARGKCVVFCADER